MKIILAVAGSLGDIRPMIALGLELKKQGHQVAINTTRDFEEYVAKYDFTFYPVEYNFMENVTKKNDLLAERRSNDLKTLMNHEFKMQYDGLQKAAQGMDIIIGNIIHTAVAAMGIYYNIPYYITFHTPQFFKSKYHAPVWFSKAGLPKLVNMILWKVADTMTNKMMMPYINELHDALGIHHFHDLHTHIYEHAVLVADEEFARVPPDVKSPYIQTGYWHLEDDEALPAELVTFIHAGKKPIYIGFGSMTEHDVEVTNDVIRRLLDAGERLIVGKGALDLGTNITHDTLYVTDHVPHDKLFPLLAAVVHHGGIGTFTTCVKSGTPQVIVPHYLDQFYYGNVLYKLKLIPKPVKKKDLAAKLMPTINKAISLPIYKEKALAYRKIIMQRNGVKDFIAETISNRT